VTITGRNAGKLHSPVPGRKHSVKLTVVIKEQEKEGAMERKHRKMSRALASPRVAMAMVSGWDPRSLFKVKAPQAPPFLSPKMSSANSHLLTRKSRPPRAMQASSIEEAPLHARRI